MEKSNKPKAAKKSAKKQRQQPRQKKPGNQKPARSGPRKKKKTGGNQQPSAGRRKIAKTASRVTKAKSHSKQAQRRHQPNRRKPRSIPGDPDLVRVVPLGGVEEVGRNMLVIEIGEDIFVADVGFEFTGDDAAPGVDYIIPNTSYLEQRQDRIKGVFITHGHLDHIGGIPYIMHRIGNPPIYTCKLTAQLITKRQEEFKGRPELRIRHIIPGDRIQVGQTHVTAFPVTHSIPDSVGLKFETPQGNIVVSGDMKLDHSEGEPSSREKQVWGRLAQEKNLLFISDSTNAERPGFSITESEVAHNISTIIRRTKGRIVLGTFASQLARIFAIMDVCREIGRKVVIEGRGIATNLEIANSLGMVKIPDGLIIEASELREHDENKVLILATGAQGEEFAALRRMAVGSHRYIKLQRSDTVMLASSVIPGNERAVQGLRDLLFQHEVEIITYRTSDIHSTGHGNIGELLWIHKTVAPDYFMPGYGFRSMTFSHAEAVIADGYPRERVILADNGIMADFREGELSINEDKADVALTVVDGSYIGKMAPQVVRERQAMLTAGIFILQLVVSGRGKKLRQVGDTQVVVRGAHLPENPGKLLGEIQNITRGVVEQASLAKTNRRFDEIKGEISSRVNSLFRGQRNRPLVEVLVLDGLHTR